MNKLLHKSVALILCVAVVFSLFAISSTAGPIDDVKNQIDKLESQIKDKANEINSIRNDKKEQQKVKRLYDEQMALLQSQINICNSKIRETNENIAKNETEILNKEKEMETVILDFKKRMSAIYMNGSTNSGIEILLGADDFSDFLALSQLTVNISRHDKKLINDITEMIKEINARTEEIKKLIDEQNEIKKTLDVKYAEFDKLAKDVQRDINELASDELSASNDKKRLEADLKEKQNHLNQLLNPSTGNVYKGEFDGTFTWPVPGYVGTSSGWGERWGTFHYGIDIASGGINGKPVIASASGYVGTIYTSCPHNYNKQSSCYNSSGRRCGGGYGNYVVISHGKSGKYYYQTMYAHMSSVAVRSGQYVKQGQVIGYVGTTGYSTGPHLHFEIHRSSNGVNYSPINPENYVKKIK